MRKLNHNRNHKQCPDALGGIMTRQEFLDTLGRTLRRELPEQEVMDNLRYYEDYVNRQVMEGKS